jgi:SAM-dependent methyltransferase
LFEIGKEVVAYRSPEECAALIKYYLAHPREAEKIAQAGQCRTIRDHTYQNRMEHTAEVLERHLRYRAESRRFSLPDTNTISHGHTSIEKSEISETLVTAWKSPEIPLKQRALVQKELGNMYRGRSPAVFQVLADCLRSVIYEGATVLEVGCASGYYYEVLEYLLKKRINFTGVDYSEPLVQMAKDFYPKAKFQVADGASLPYGESSLLVVVSSGVLLHTPNYKAHIAEAARVAKEHVVAHRTPVCRKRETLYLKKYGYGVPMFELIFNEREILSDFASQGLALVKHVEYEAAPANDTYGVTYLFKKGVITQ